MFQVLHHTLQSQELFDKSHLSETSSMHATHIFTILFTPKSIFFKMISRKHQTDWHEYESTGITWISFIGDNDHIAIGAVLICSQFENYYYIIRSKMWWLTQSFRFSGLILNQILQQQKRQPRIHIKISTTRSFGCSILCLHCKSILIICRLNISVVMVCHISMFSQNTSPPISLSYPPFHCIQWTTLGILNFSTQ